MTATALMLSTMSGYDAWRWAEELFEARDYYRAAEVLEHLLADEERDSDLDQVRELLARSYYHSARLDKATVAARELVARRPDDGYATLLLARALERASRPQEAAAARRRAETLGAA